MVDSEEFAPGPAANFVLMSISASSDLLIQLVVDSPLARLISWMYFFLECHSVFLWSTNTHFCLQVSQESSKRAVNSETIKITSHLDVFPCPASETRNHSRNKKAMITWVSSLSLT